MRTKILLAGATAGVEGPPVRSGDGIWEITSHPFVSVTWPEGSKVKVLPDKIILHGGVRVRTKVNPKYNGPPIHLDMIQVG